MKEADLGDGEPAGPSAPIRAIASVFYGLGARAHRKGASWLRASRGRPACAVLSVGGLTVGGAGKTPVAAALARNLHDRGHRVVLASRGYRGNARDAVTVVSDGRYARSTVSVSGDESFVLAGHAPGVPVLVGRDRRVVGHHAVSFFDAEILVLDDGFQHHRLARDVDIVCIDGVAGLGNRRVLPWGPLREPVSALRNADWLCVVDGARGGREADLVDEFAANGGGVLHGRRRATHLTSLDRRSRVSSSSLSGRRVGLIAGVARPASLRKTVEELGAVVVAERFFDDHHAYREREIAALDTGVPEWVTTEKDALKILPEWLGPARVSVLEIEVEFEGGDAAIDPIESALLRSRERSSAG